MFLIILFVSLIYIASFAWLLLRSVALKNPETKKITFTFSEITVSRVISKLLWAIVCTAAVVYCITLILPLIWMLYSSLKGEFEFRFDSFGLPNPVYWSNYVDILERLKVTTGKGVTYTVLDMLLNSLVYTTGGSLKFLFWTTLVAYAMSRFDFKFTKLLYSFGILLMLIPVTGTMASRMILYRQLNLYDNMLADVFLVPTPTAFSGLNFMIIYAALKGIPKEYSEAARIDGANEYRIMGGIIIPMVLPTLITIFILSFVGAWNSYEDFLVWYPSTPNLAYGMYEFQYKATAGSAGNAASTPMILAGLVLSMIPSMLIYLSAQKIMRSNFTVGGLKG